MEYKGFKIEVYNTGDGYSMGSHRISDTWMLVDAWNPSIKNKTEAIRECKIAIDDYYNNPNDYED